MTLMVAWRVMRTVDWRIGADSYVIDARPLRAVPFKLIQDRFSCRLLCHAVAVRQTFLDGKGKTRLTCRAVPPILAGDQDVFHGSIVSIFCANAWGEFNSSSFRRHVLP